MWISFAPPYIESHQPFTISMSTTEEEEVRSTRSCCFKQICIGRISTANKTWTNYRLICVHRICSCSSFPSFYNHHIGKESFKNLLDLSIPSHSTVNYFHSPFASWICELLFHWPLHLIKHSKSHWWTKYLFELFFYVHVIQLAVDWCPWRALSPLNGSST